MYLLDSNICIYLINQRPEHVVEKIKEHKPDEIKLSAISFGELNYGVAKSKFRNKNKQALLHFASAFDIIEFDSRDAEVYGLIRADLENKGELIGSYDMQIAAQAISRDITLVTNNKKEFSRILNLRIKNWV